MNGVSIEADMIHKYRPGFKSYEEIAATCQIKASSVAQPSC
jgi:hypothetical protein